MKPISGFIITGFLLLPASLYSDTINVPADYPAIQQAIDAAVNGDTVLVAPGTYVENIDFLGKAITVKSDQGARVTAIDGNQLNSVVYFINNENLDSTLNGFTITNGSYWDGGGGIRCIDSSPTISNNIIFNNSYIASKCRGGGIYSLYGSPSICNNRIIENELDNNQYTDVEGAGICINYGSPCIKGNYIGNNIAHGGEYASGRGGGIYCANDTSKVINNVIEKNRGTMGGGVHLYSSQANLINNIINDNISEEGGGIDIRHGSSASIVNNVIYNNSVIFSGGGVVSYISSCKIINNIIWANDYPVIIVYSGTLDVTYSNIQSGWPGEGNINQNPLFVDPNNGDFHLTYNSPCLNIGDNSAVTEPCDFDGNPRIYQGTVDMGADEFHPHLYVTGHKMPGGSIQGKLVGLPVTNPVGLFVGSGILSSPANTMWGEFHLQAPWFLFGPLGAIPANGVMVLPTTLPSGMTVPVDIPMQALIGLNADSLTNLYVLEVR